MAPELVDMPVEIFDAIIDWLPPMIDGFKHCHDLTNLRRVCCAIETKTRLRFGRDHMFEINVSVTPQYLLWNSGILADELFRTCVRQLNLYVGDVGRPFKPLNDDSMWGYGIDFLCHGEMQHIFEEILTMMPLVKQIAIYDPPIDEKATAQTHKNINCHWHIVVSATLAAVQAQKPAYLSGLQIGSGEYGELSLPIFVLHGMAKDSTALMKLHRLVLCRVVENDRNRSVSSLGCTPLAESFTDFVALAPNLKWLSYTGHHVYRPELSRTELLVHMARRPALTALDFAKLNLFQSDLLEGIIQFRSTLRKVSLYSVFLIPEASWRTIFHKLERDLDLSYLSLRYLSENYKVLRFDEILAQRPFMLERPSDLFVATYDELLYLPRIAQKYMIDNDYSESSNEDLQKDMKVLEDLLEDGWVWVEHDIDLGSRCFQLVLDAEEGDDVKMWLGKAASRYGLQ